MQRDYVPNREIRDAIEFAKRQGERNMPSNFFPILYAMIVRRASPEEITNFVKMETQALYVRLRYPCPECPQTEWEDHARFLCRICITMAREHPERIATWLR
jgi:hypothetical protein